MISVKLIIVALRDICFHKLVFLLDHKQVEEIAKQIESIEYDKEPKKAASEITLILQDSLNNEKRSLNKYQKDRTKKLINLFESFTRSETEKRLSANSLFETDQTNIVPSAANSITFWHFAMLREENQIKAFKSNNFVLSLIEYGEDWRTGMVRLVKPGDVIFLFKRGGAGYIGAFRALDPPNKILEVEKYDDYSEDEKEKYDIYGGLDDDADYSSNILVEPIAYNYKGVGYYTVRRRTIERMNDSAAVNYLLPRFNGNELEADIKAGMGKLDAETEIALNSEYFFKLVREQDIDNPS
jgi:hypothetical protein